MQKVIVNDGHVHDIHSGMELFLVKVTDLDGDESITGFRPVDGPSQGMFCGGREPVQVLRQDDDGSWVFTMCQLSDVKRSFVDELIANGKAVIEDIYKGQTLFRLEFEVL